MDRPSGRVKHPADAQAAADCLTIRRVSPIFRLTRPPRRDALNRMREADMYVWSKRIAIGLLAAFAILLAWFLIQSPGAASSNLKIHTTRWITLNYTGLVMWVFVWMFDQARVRAKNVWLWVVPFLFAPLPVLMLFILYLQRKLPA